MTLGRTAFEAYSKARGGVNSEGVVIPDWEDLPEKIIEAWKSVAAALSYEKQLEALEYGPKHFVVAGTLLRLLQRLTNGDTSLVQVSIDQDFEPKPSIHSDDLKTVYTPGDVRYTFIVRPR